MTIWNNIKLRFIALIVLLKVWWNFTNKSALLNEDRKQGNGVGNKRLQNPLNKLYRQELAGTRMMKRSEIARYEFVSGLSESTEEGLEEGLYDTVQTLVLWICDLRGGGKKPADE